MADLPIVHVRIRYYPWSELELSDPEQRSIAGPMTFIPKPGEPFAPGYMLAFETYDDAAHFGDPVISVTLRPSAQ